MGLAEISELLPETEREREREDERMHVSLVSDEDFTSDFRCLKSPTAIATVLRLGLMRVEKNISFKGA